RPEDRWAGVVILQENPHDLSLEGGALAIVQGGLQTIDQRLGRRAAVAITVAVPARLGVGRRGAAEPPAFPLVVPDRVATEPRERKRRSILLVAYKGSRN